MGDISILVAGDFCVRGNSEIYADAGKAQKLTAELKSRILKADLSMVNAETVFTDDESPILKSGPALRSSEKSLEILKNLGFTIAAYANNHSFDQGAENMLLSMERMRKAGMYVIGAGKNNEEANKILYIQKKNKTIAFLNFAEHEFGYAKEDSPGTAGLDFFENTKLIKEARKNSDAVIVYIHGGCEHCPIPRPGLVKICRGFADAGAGAVVVSHSHCPVGYEIYNNVPICYGTGNFYMAALNSGMEDTLWNTGYMAEFTVSDENITLSIVPYVFGLNGEYLRLLSSEENKIFMEYLKEISQIINNKLLYKKLWNAWCSIYMNGWARDFIRNFNIDNSPSDEYVLFVRNSYVCESHSEVMKTYYAEYCDNDADDIKYKEMIKKYQKRLF